MNAAEQNHRDPRSAGHEPDLVNVTRVVWTSAGLVLLVVLALALMYGLLSFLNREPATGEAPSLVNLPPLASGTPRLNPNQPRQLQELRRKQDALLDRYEWIDRQRGIARIPIERAMAILAERGLAAPLSKERSDEKPSGE